MLNLVAIAKLMQHRQPVASSPSFHPFQLRGQQLTFLRPLLMGVINLSPDSAYKESICTEASAAIARGRELAQQGARLIDIGAESTLGQAKRVAPAEQIERLQPVIKALAAEGLLVSVESYYPQVLEAAAQAGAAIFNLTGAVEEKEAYRLAAKHQTAVIHCYVQGEHVRQVGNFEFLPDMIASMQQWFQQRLQLAQQLGVQQHILDPGLGFYYDNLKDSPQRVHHQLHTLLNTWRLHILGWPLMNILPHAPEAFGNNHRRQAEPFFAVFALMGGTQIIRTHELETVAAVKQALEMYQHG